MRQNDTEVFCCSVRRLLIPLTRTHSTPPTGSDDFNPRMLLTIFAAAFRHCTENRTYMCGRSHCGGRCAVLSERASGCGVSQTKPPNHNTIKQTQSRARNGLSITIGIVSIPTKKHITDTLKTTTEEPCTEQAHNPVHTCPVCTVPIGGVRIGCACRVRCHVCTFSVAEPIQPYPKFQPNRIYCFCLHLSRAVSVCAQSEGE